MSILEAVRASLRLLDRRDRRLLGLATVAQAATSLFDLVGVVLIGMVGALGVAGIEGNSPPRRVTALLSPLGLEDLPVGKLVSILAGVAAVLLLTKSVLSPIVMTRVFRFLARREALVSARLTKELLSRPLTFLNLRSSQQTATALISGVNCAAAVLGQLVVAVSEAALLVVLSIVLLLTNPAAALAAIVFFALVGVGLQRGLGHRAAELGKSRMLAEVAGLSAVQEALGTYRELTVSDRRSLYVEHIRNIKAEHSQAYAGLQLVYMLPKYISEAALVLGSVALAAALFATQSAAAAMGTFSLFLAAGTRVMPSLLRLQTATLSMRAAAGGANLTVALAEELDHPLAIPHSGEALQVTERALRGDYSDFHPTIDINDVSFTYPDSRHRGVHGINLKVAVGQSVAFVGGSGAGKSTLADLVLGILEPQSGSVRLAGLPPSEAVQRWPGGIAYVPQEVMLANDTVRANVALGFPREVIDDDLVWSALRRAQLEDHLRSQPDGLDAEIGERGLRLSGGQRQRLGIARALFTRPRLLVLDEATSALDAETEQAVAKMLEDLDADVTTVVIAHRLSTIRNADIVVYLDEGAMLAAGRFDEVCRQVPALRRQASLMGLKLA